MAQDESAPTCNEALFEVAILHYRRTSSVCNEAPVEARPPDITTRALPSQSCSLVATMLTSSARLLKKVSTTSKVSSFAKANPRSYADVPKDVSHIKATLRFAFLVSFDSSHCIHSINA